MLLSREEIIELALRYISEDEITDFPQEDDLFCFMERKVPEGKVLKESEGWHFGGYAICKGYEYDTESKPEGKWLWFNFVSLNTFPPTRQNLKLQPPHIAKGIFMNSDRNSELKMVRIPEYFLDADALQSEQDAGKKEGDSDAPPEDKIIPFPQKK